MLPAIKVKRHVPSRTEVGGYIKLGKIGEGTYGVVYKAQEKTSKKVVALKRMRLDQTEGLPSTTIREISLLKGLNHSNIVKLEGVILEHRKMYLVFEYLERDLKSLLENRTNGLPLQVAKHYMKQIFNGIAFCHSRMIMHRDLKPQNLLVDDRDNVKIADFGLARNFSVPLRPYSQEIVTLWYRAPEILLGTMMYSPTIDVWSIGCILPEMLTKNILFPGDSEIGQLFEIFKFLGTPDDESWPGISALKYYKQEFPKFIPQNMSKKLGMLDASGTDLLIRMLTYHPQWRLTAYDGLSHPFLNDS